MKFSALARTYDRVAAAPREPERAKLLAQVCKRADRPTPEELSRALTALTSELEQEVATAQDGLTVLRA